MTERKRRIVRLEVGEERRNTKPVGDEGIIEHVERGKGEENMAVRK